MRLGRHRIMLCALIASIGLCIGCDMAAPAVLPQSAKAGEPPTVSSDQSGAASAKNAQNSPAAEADEQPGEMALAHPFPRRMPAPPLTGGSAWLNTADPIEIKDLRGKFVLLDFWTYCCINCMHVLPELKKLEQAYPNNLVVIGVHSGKFDAERDDESIRQAVMRHEIEHPVVNDADQKIWDRYQCQSWPSLRVIDPEGNLVAMHSGEIDFDTLDRFFREALPYYRRKKLLDEKPLSFKLERDQAAPTPLRYPGKILADPSRGMLFIADSNHHRIAAASLDGTLQFVVGSGSAGRRDGDFQTAQFNQPQGMALHGDVLYVADTENHLLRKVDLENATVTTIAGTGKQGRTAWPGVDENALFPQLPERFVGKPRETAINSPWALAIQGDDLFIAMAGYHQIWKMPLDETEIGPYAGNAREDIVDGELLPASPYASGYASFAQPSGLAGDGKWLYVADCEGSSIRAVPFDPEKSVRTLIGTAHLPFARLFAFGDADGGPKTAKLQHCLGVVHHDGKLYIADTYNNKIKRIDLADDNCKTLAGSGKPGLADGEGKAAAFFEPAGLSYADGKLYVADTNNHVIRVVDLKENKVSTLEIAGLSPPSQTQPGR